MPQESRREGCEAYSNSEGLLLNQREDGMNWG